MGEKKEKMWEAYKEKTEKKNQKRKKFNVKKFNEKVDRQINQKLKNREKMQDFKEHEYYIQCPFAPAITNKSRIIAHDMNLQPI